MKCANKESKENLCSASGINAKHENDAKHWKPCAHHAKPSNALGIGEMTEPRIKWWGYCDPDVPDESKEWIKNYLERGTAAGPVSIDMLDYCLNAAVMPNGDLYQDWPDFLSIARRYQVEGHLEAILAEMRSQLVKKDV